MVSKSKYEIPVCTFHIGVQTRLGKCTLSLLNIANNCSLATVIIVYCSSEKTSPLTVKEASGSSSSSQLYS